MKDVGHFTRVFISTLPVDFRKQAYGLVAFVKESLGEDPLDAKAIFIFTNRRKGSIRLLYWDLTGFAVWSKTLEKATYAWPKADSSGKLLITQRQLKWLLQGVDLDKIKTHPPVEFTRSH